MSTSQNPIVADYFEPGVCYEIDRNGELVPVPETASVRGYAGVIQAGLLQKHGVIIALYAHERRLWLRIGSELVDFTDSSAALHVRKRVPFVRTLTVSRDGHTALRLKYWARLRELSEWPVYGDITDYFVEQTSSQERRRELLKGWTATGAGEDLSREDVQVRLRHDLAQPDDRP